MIQIPEFLVRYLFLHLSMVENSSRHHKNNNCAPIGRFYAK